MFLLSSYGLALPFAQFLADTFIKNKLEKLRKGVI